MVFRNFVCLIIIGIMTEVNGMEDLEMKHAIEEEESSAESLNEYEPVRAKDRRTLCGTIGETVLDPMYYVENGGVPRDTWSFCSGLCTFCGSLKSREYSNWEFVFDKINNKKRLECFFKDPYSSFYVLHQAIIYFTHFCVDDVIRFCEEEKMQPDAARAIHTFLKTFWLAMIHLPILTEPYLIFDDYTRCEFEPVFKGLKKIYRMETVDSANELLQMLKNYKDILYDAGRIIGTMENKYFLDNDKLRYLR